MKTVWLVCEFGNSYIEDLDDVKVFSTREKAELYLDKRIEKIMQNRNDLEVSFEYGDKCLLLLDEDGYHEYDEYGCKLEYARFFIRAKQIDEES